MKFKIGDRVVVTDSVYRATRSYPCKNKTGIIKAIEEKEAAVLFDVEHSWAPGCKMYNDNTNYIINKGWGLWIEMSLLAQLDEYHLKSSKLICKCNLMITGCICGVMEAERKAKHA